VLEKYYLSSQVSETDLYSFNRSTLSFFDIIVIMNIFFSTGLLVLFSVFNAVLLKNQRNEIPTRDVVASALVVLSAYAVLVLEELYFHHPRTKSAIAKPTTPAYRRDVNALMLSEVVFDLVVPWILLSKNAAFWHRKLDHLLESETGGEGDGHNVLGYLLVPHLFFFQAQIVGELMFYVAGRGSLVFPYTCMANAYRFFPLGTCIRRSYAAFRNASILDPFHWLVVVLLPSIIAMLWVYSSFVFVPLEWYPLTKASPSSTGGAPQQRKGTKVA